MAHRHPPNGIDRVYRTGPPEDRREQPCPVAKDRRREDVLATPTGLSHEGTRLPQGRPSRPRQKPNRRIPEMVVAPTEGQ
ncbi:hypothetical protein J437_LFUL016124 [Ladona fulva]|uniref:Uncharacterized protein n=1 Tax=Ladona fulva TaxID=123851 RepID=A0A8K0P6M9_LADFU|nr:hypothetical protein J437_LFUL016124 [Ladona fulva]